MAKKWFTNLEINFNELLDALLHKSSAPLGSPVEGQVYYDTSTHQDYVYDGSDWVGDADETLYWMQVNP